MRVCLYMLCVGLRRENKQCPDMLMRYIYLRGDIIRCSAKRLCGLVAHDSLFAHTEIRDFYVAVLVQQHVVQFQVPVNDAVEMQIKQSDRYFRGIKSGKYNIMFVSQCGHVKLVRKQSTYTATGSLNFPHCWI